MLGNRSVPSKYFCGMALIQSQAIDAQSLERIVESHEGRALNLIVWSSKLRSFRRACSSCFLEFALIPRQWLPLSHLANGRWISQPLRHLRTLNHPYLDSV